MNALRVLSSCSRGMLLLPAQHRWSLAARFDQHNQINQRTFSTSGPRRLSELSPFYILAVRPLVRGVLLPFAGRTLRAWWQRLPPDRKQHIKSTGKVRRTLLSSLAMYYVLLGGAYFANLEQVEPTSRTRLRLISNGQYKAVSDLQFSILLRRFDKLLLDESHETCRKVKGIAMHILDANRMAFPEIGDQEWTMSIIDLPLRNAMVMAGGKIIVFRGLIDFCRNDDELANILCHEISHTLLGHGAELMSRNLFVDALSLPVIAPVWFLMPSFWGAAFATTFLYMAGDLACQLPYSRMLELEADEVGIAMAARACFDVREVVAFWTWFDAQQKRDLGYSPQSEMPRTLHYFSTHPTNSERARRLDQLVDSALDLRVQHQCKPLPSIDPRHRTELEVKLLQQQHDERMNRRVISLVRK